VSRDIVIAVPCWGKHYRDLFLGPVLRSHRAAIDALQREYRGSIAVRYVVQTDDPVAVATALAGYEMTLVPPPTEIRARNPMRAMATAHAHGIQMARTNERVVLLNADIMVSTEAFVAMERQFRSGKKCIVTCGTRTLPGFLGPPGPLRSRQLHAWSMRHPHPITMSCFWGSGKCHLPWGVYFREGKSIILRAFHLHPFAVVKDRPLKFDGTIDMDLADSYQHDEIHVVTDIDEMAIVEMSPKTKGLGDNPWNIDVGQILAWALRGARPMHWWNFRHRICVQGDPDSVKEDIEVADEVLRMSPFAEAIDASV
jgi:hypothetical protein